MADIALVDVDEDVLAEMVDVATSDAAPDEVTAPLDDGTAWTQPRIDWLRALHRDRRPGLAGPLGEATWAIVVDGRVAGAIRLKRTSEPGVLETGMWLARGARGRGVAAAALRNVLERAAATGARAVRADTTAGNAAALAVLSRLGFQLTHGADDGVHAVRRLDAP
ncbi:MAG TPA: GNAT family N-acetyltransferase [Jatrophihabitans sp.]|nr:GNAT family N-acetyltransferase [Jatrophihabitans sp.]